MVIRWFIVLILALTLPLVSCSKKATDHTTIQIQFNNTQLGQSNGTLAKNSASSADGGPNWGLTDPTSLSDIDCWGVFVGGPEDFMSGSRCSNANGDVIAKFGPRAGFYPINKSGEVKVPLGDKKRRFWLAGMGSDDGTCQLGFDKNAKIEFAKYSAPFILGVEDAEIGPDNKLVRISLHNHFEPANRIESCDFIEPDEIGPDPSLEVTLFKTARKVWIDDNDTPRTVNFTYNEDVGTAQCAVDGSEIDCSSGGFIWEWDDRGKEHVVRVVDAEGKVLGTPFRFTPEDEYPGLSIENCDVSVPGGSLAGLATPLSGTNNIICFAAGITISGSSAALGIGSGNVLLTRIGQTPATITNTSASDSTFIVGGSSDNVHIYGLNIQGNQTPGNYTVNVQDADGTVFSDVKIINNGGGSALRVYSASDDIRVEAHKSEFQSPSGGDGKGVYVLSSTPTIIPEMIIKEKSVLAGSGAGLSTDRGAKVFVDDSELIGIDSTSFGFYARWNTELRITNSEIENNGNYGNQIHCNFASDPYTPIVKLENNIFRRVDMTNANGAAINFSDCNSGNDAPRLHSDQNNNVFCNVNSVNASYTQILQNLTSSHADSTFDPVLNNDGLANNVVQACDP